MAYNKGELDYTIKMLLHRTRFQMRFLGSRAEVLLTLGRERQTLNTATPHPLTKHPHRYHMPRGTKYVFLKEDRGVEICGPFKCYF